MTNEKRPATLTLDLDLLTKEQATAIAKALRDDPRHDETIRIIVMHHGEREWVAECWMGDHWDFAEETGADSAIDAAEEYVASVDWSELDDPFVKIRVWSRRWLPGAVVDECGEPQTFTLPVNKTAPKVQA